MSDRTTAVGDPVFIKGEFAGVNLAKGAALVRTSGGTLTIPVADVLDGNAEAEARWIEHRDAVRARGVAHNGISKRDFLAGFAASH